MYSHGSGRVAHLTIKTVTELSCFSATIVAMVTGHKPVYLFIVSGFNQSSECQLMK